MKRCPKCSRTFPDENQKFCTFDGGLLRGDQPAFDPNMTIRATSADLNETQVVPPPPNDSSEAKTSVRLEPLNETIASFGSNTFRETTPVGAQTSSDLVMPPTAAESAPTSLDLSRHAVPPPPPPQTSQPLPPAAQTPVTVETPAPAPPTAAAVAQPAKKKSILPWVLAALVILLILGGGAAAAGYFLVLKPMMDAKREPVRPATTVNVNTSSTPEEKAPPTNVNAAVEVKKGPEPFVPPAGAVQFTNSAANLDGDLASHYLEFSFYYPKDWKKDPQSGVAGAGSFAKLDSQSTDETGAYLKERVLFSWYPTKGSFDADKDVFPQSANKIVDQLSKSLKNFEEVSRGETTLNTYKGYEVRFKGTFKDTGKGDLPYWGRVIFLPPGSKAEKGGVAIVMLATSLSSDVTSADDVGDKGGLGMILNSFRLGSE